MRHPGTTRRRVRAGNRQQPAHPGRRGRAAGRRTHRRAPSPVVAAMLRQGRAHGLRIYSLAWIPIPASAEHRWILIRPNDSTSELAQYLTYSLPPSAYPPWCTWPAKDARPRNASKPAKASPGWTNTKSADGRLAPLGHPGHARPRVPHRDRRHRRTRHPADTRRADPGHRQRAPPPVRRATPTAQQRLCTHRPLVHLAPTTPSPRQSQPLPAASPITMITNHGRSTRQRARHHPIWTPGCTDSGDGEHPRNTNLI